MKIFYAFLLLTVLGGCNSNSQTAAITEAAPPARPTTTLPVASGPPARSVAVAAVLGNYEGSMGGKFPFRLSITASEPDSQLVGIYYYYYYYYYRSQHKPIELRGGVAPTGDIWLREYTPQPSAGAEAKMQTWKTSASQPRLPFARFMVRRAPDGALVGTWQEARTGRHRPVHLTRYQSHSPAEQAHLGEQRYFEEFTIPVFTVPDPGVTRRLWEVFGVEQLTDMSLTDLRTEHQLHDSASIAQGFGGVYSEVTYNRHGLLSVDLHTEYTAANVSHHFQSVVVDLHTGEPLSDEINPAREAQFLAACERKLQAQLAAYIAEEYPDVILHGDNYDVVGLRSQHIGPQNPPDEMSIGAGSVRFHYPVNYNSQSNMMFKQFQNRFWLEFSYAELQPLLKPVSPLHRLR